MDTCAAETGLLRKKPCGHAAVAKCANCEMALCGQHAVAQPASASKKGRTFLCKECAAAQREYDKNVPAAAPAAQPAAAKVPAEKAQAPKPAPAAAAPGKAPAAGAPQAKTPPTKEPPAKPHDSADDPLEFNPTKK